MTLEVALLRYARNLFSLLTVLSLLALASAATAADLRLGPADQGRLSQPILSEHMVLQRGQALPVWGEGVTGSQVNLERRDPATGRIVATASAAVAGEAWRT